MNPLFVSATELQALIIELMTFEWVRMRIVVILSSFFSSDDDKLLQIKFSHSFDLQKKIIFQ